jgi:hypothetical protein
VNYGLHAECRVPLAYRKAGPTRGVMLTYMSYRPELRVLTCTRCSPDVFYRSHRQSSYVVLCGVSVYSQVKLRRMIVPLPNSVGRLFDDKATPMVQPSTSRLCTLNVAKLERFT